jgi:hypothetical protein
MFRFRHLTAIRAPFGAVAVLLVVFGASAIAQPKSVNLTDLRDAVNAADKRGDNVSDIRKALDALEKAPPGIKTGTATTELRALRAAVDVAAKKGENVEEIAKQLAVVETAVAGKPRLETHPLYYPTGTGAKWVYKRPSGEDPEYSVKASERKGDTVIASIRDHAYYMGDSVHWKIIVSPEGLRKEEPRGENGWILKTGLPSGSSWKGPGGHTRTVFGPEEVKTRAGTFMALRVEWYEGVEANTVWYAPNIGEIKSEIRYKGEVTWERSLRSFTPPERK